jgi:hypothetical protein
VLTYFGGAKYERLTTSIITGLACAAEFWTCAIQQQPERQRIHREHSGFLDSGLKLRRLVCNWGTSLSRISRWSLGAQIDVCPRVNKTVIMLIDALWTRTAQGSTERDSLETTWLTFN